MADTISTKELEKAKDLLSDVGSQLNKVVKDLQANMSNIVDKTGSFTKGWKDAVLAAQSLNDNAQKYVALENATSILRQKINELKSTSLALDSLGLKSKLDEIELQEKILIAQQTYISTQTMSVHLKNQLIDYYDIEIQKNKALYDAYKTVGTSQNKTINNLETMYNSLVSQMASITNKQSNFNNLLEFANKLLGFQIKEFLTLEGIFTKIFTAFTAIEDTSFEVRKNLGLIGKDGDRFKTIITDTYVKFSNLGVTAEMLGKTINNIANILGSSMLVTQSMVENFSLLETSLGLTSDQSVKVSRVLGSISKNSTMAQSSMIGFAKELSKAAGTSFIKVMEDLANLSESVRLTFRGTTTQLIKSVVEARRMGLTIAEIGVAAEKLLEFQESINAEIEASVMLGKNISFNDARVLAYRGDILGATKQILDTVEKTADLNQLDYFTLKSIAASTGLTVDKLQESLQIRKDLRLVEAMGTDEARKLVSEYKSLNNMSESFAKNEGERALENLKTKNNLALQKQLQTELNALIIQLGQAFLPVLQSFAVVLQYLTDINTWLRKTIGDTGAKWVSALISVGVVITVLKTKWKDLFSTMLNWIPIMKKMKAAEALGNTVAGGTSAAGSVASGVGMWKNLLGVGAIILATAAALFIIGKALKEFPADIGGMGYFEFFAQLTLGLGLFIGGLMGLGALIEGPLGLLLGIGALVIVGISLVLAGLGKSMQSIANPIKTFSDSFSKLMENINVDNLSRMKDGVVAVKEAMSELRDELQKFKKDDLDVLDKLGNFKTNISAGVKGESVTGKESANTAMIESIKSAVVEGMKQAKFTLTIDGKAIAVAVATTMQVAQPATQYGVSTQQSSFV